MNVNTGSSFRTSNVIPDLIRNPLNNGGMLNQVQHDAWTHDA
jgi:hypothetical protein